MLHITSELEKKAKEAFTKMILEKKNTATISKTGTNIKLTLIKKGSPEEKKFADTIIKEIKSHNGSFFISR